VKFKIDSIDSSLHNTYIVITYYNRLVQVYYSLIICYFISQALL